MLVRSAREHEIPGATGMRKQELIFEILRGSGRDPSVITGGDLSGAQEVTEDYMLGLEREVFLGLLGQQKTQDRVAYLLENNKPLRN